MYMRIMTMNVLTLGSGVARMHAAVDQLRWYSLALFTEQTMTV
jgi:hypothetical protein